MSEANKPEDTAEISTQVKMKAGRPKKETRWLEEFQKIRNRYIEKQYFELEYKKRNYFINHEITKEIYEMSINILDDDMLKEDILDEYLDLYSKNLKTTYKRLAKKITDSNFCDYIAYALPIYKKYGYHLSCFARIGKMNYIISKHDSSLVENKVTHFMCPSNYSDFTFSSLICTFSTLHDCLLENKEDISEDYTEGDYSSLLSKKQIAKRLDKKGIDILNKGLKGVLLSDEEYKFVIDILKKEVGNYHHLDYSQRQLGLLLWDWLLVSQYNDNQTHAKEFIVFLEQLKLPRYKASSALYDELQDAYRICSLSIKEGKFLPARASGDSHHPDKEKLGANSIFLFDPYYLALKENKLYSVQDSE